MQSLAVSNPTLPLISNGQPANKITQISQHSKQESFFQNKSVFSQKINHQKQKTIFQKGSLKRYKSLNNFVQDLQCWKTSERNKEIQFIQKKISLITKPEKRNLLSLINNQGVETQTLDEQQTGVKLISNQISLLNNNDVITKKSNHIIKKKKELFTLQYETRQIESINESKKEDAMAIDSSQLGISCVHSDLKYRGKLKIKRMEVESFEKLRKNLNVFANRLIS